MSPLVADVEVPRRSAGGEQAVRLMGQADFPPRISPWREFVRQQGQHSVNHDPTWLLALAQGRRHQTCCLEARAGDQLTGLLPLALVEGPLFGRFLVSLPWLSSGGVCCLDEQTGSALVDRAVRLADELQVQFLELRHERPVAHPALRQIVTDKVHMRLELPQSEADLWQQLSRKVRHQIRKADRLGFREIWGGVELLDEFYAVFSRRMRELGSPVDGRPLFASVLAHFPAAAELCVVREGTRPVAGALVLHGREATEMIRSAALSELRPTAINTWLHGRVMLRAMAHGSRVLDLGRPTIGSSVHTFKSRLGALPQPSAWQHYIRGRSPAEIRRASGKFDAWIQLWRRLPLPVTRCVGPAIARGLP